MNFYEISPEVSGEIGERSIGDLSTWPPTVHQLDFLFHGWMGGCIVTSFPVFLVTSIVAKELGAEGLLGFDVAAVTTSLSEEYLELYPHEGLPDFRWLKIHGSAGIDDFFLTDQNLIVSERALAVLTRHGLGRDTSVAEWR